MSPQAKHVQDRRKLGFCAYSGCPVKSGDVFRCEDHAKLHAATMKRHRDKLAAEAKKEASP